MRNLTAVELTRQLLRFNTINPPGNERDCADHLGRLLQQGGFNVSYYEFAPGRTSLVARSGGADDKPLCFTGHIDTVPLGAAPWRRDPFAGEIMDKKLYGRGASDMKSGVAAFVTAALQLGPRLAATAGVVLVITAGEETGCEGARHLERLKGVLGKAGAIIVGEPTANYPLVGHKGALWLQGRVRGVTAHGSMPERGDNAIYKAARAVTLLERFAFNVPQHPAMGNATLNVGTFHGGININSVPDEALIGIDLRTLPSQHHAEVREDLERYLGNEIALTPVVDVPSMWTESSDPWVQNVFDILTPMLGEKPQPRAVSYFTDAPSLRNVYGAPPTVILGPGEPDMAHQTDEYCYLEKIEQAVAAYTEIAVKWCGL
jgi:succinyl-diaminopimelate desuccinylase